MSFLQSFPGLLARQQLLPRAELRLQGHGEPGGEQDPQHRAELPHRDHGLPQ